LVQKSISEILSKATNTLEYIEGVSVSSKEQMVATEEITKAVSNIAENAVSIEELITVSYESFNQITDSLGESREDIDELTSEMNKLSEEVEFFKL